MDLKKLIDKITNGGKKNNLINIAILALVGILLVICSSFFKGSTPTISNIGTKKDNQEVTVRSNNDYEQSVQAELKNTLEQIQGVGRVQVMVTFESGEEQVPAVNVNDSTSTTQEKDNAGGTRTNTEKNNGSNVVLTNDGSKSTPLIVKTYKPKVSGVCVVAEGAENSVTTLRITKAVVDLFNLSEDKVNVYPMKK